MTIRPVVVDINHADGSREDNGRHIDQIDYEKFKRAGFLGLIHKATEGGRFVDPLYAVRRPRAIAAGLLWGAYHFMRPGDVGDQVSVFLNAAGRYPASGRPFIRYVLDYEDDKCGLWQAERWLELVHNITGQRPWLYGGGVLKDQIKRGHAPSLGQFPLWLAEYGPDERLPPAWKTAVLWQRSGDGIGPGIHDVPGIGRKMDIDYFDGTDDELRAAWLDAGSGASAGVA